MAKTGPLYEWLYCTVCEDHWIMVERGAPGDTMVKCHVSGTVNDIATIRGAMLAAGKSPKLRDPRYEVHEKP